MRSSSSRPSGSRACQRSATPGTTSDTRSPSTSCVRMNCDSARRACSPCSRVRCRSSNTSTNVRVAVACAPTLVAYEYRPGLRPGVGTAASRSPCRLEELDVLRHALVQDLEIGGGQTRHRLTAVVHDDGVDGDQGGLGAEARLRASAAGRTRRGNDAEGDEPRQQSARMSGHDRERDVRRAGPAVERRHRAQAYVPGSKIVVGNEATYLMRPSGSGAGNSAAERPMTASPRRNSNVSEGTRP